MEVELEMDEQSESDKVSIETKPLIEAYPWGAKAHVWTEPMLKALDKKLDGGKWFALNDKVFALKTLRKSYEQVRQNDGSAGVDHVTTEKFGENLEEELLKASEQIREGKYQPQKIKRVEIPKTGGGTRPLGIPTIRDRVVQTAIRDVIEPIFERKFQDNSYGFRPGKGCMDALRKVDELLKQGNYYVVDADIRSYFDNIPQDKLMKLIKEEIADGKLLTLIESFLTTEILDGLTGWTPTNGTPQGAVISPLLSNIYLDPFDRMMKEKGYQLIRYADDFVLLCQTKEDAERALEQTQRWMQENKLELHPEKTKIVDIREGYFDFLGYRFENGSRRPRPKSKDKLKDSIRAKTKRTNGNSMESIIYKLNRTTKGWFNYFKHSTKNWDFRELDGWIRMRLRCILRKRLGQRGRGFGTANRKWPNQYFHNVGLFSLQEAYAAARQSSLR
jgi:RNA-directed DNA polymerase